MNKQRIISYIASIDSVLTGPFMGVIRPGPWFETRREGKYRR